MRRKKTMDGSEAAAHVAYALTEVTAIYPITPSSAMAELADEWATKGKKNIFGQTLKVVEMQSEAGAAGAVHGSLQAGALTTTFTASQGLLLMIPNMYKMAGELLPAVFHISARALATSALSIFGDHSDVMAARQTGFAMLSESSVQEVMDLSAVAHLAALKGRVPFMNFFDGFRTSHEYQKVEVIEYEELASLVDQEALQAFKKKALNPDHPVTVGSAQNADIYFQQRETVNQYYENLPGIVEEYMGEINKLRGTNYQLVNYYGAEDAENVIIAMGSVCTAIEEVVDYLNARGGKYGLINIHLYRPFPKEHLFKAMPATVKRIAVLDRTKEPGSEGEPLYLDVKGAYYGTENAPFIIGGRYGLGSKEVTPTEIASVYHHLTSTNPFDRFTVGIVDDVTHTSIERVPAIDTAPEGNVSCKFWGFGSDGTVGANKTAVKLIGDNTDMHVQAYFAYDSKKSGGVTISHLRFGKNEIKSSYLISHADFIACHNESYIFRYDVLEGLKENGTFLLNSSMSEEKLMERMPSAMKRYLAEKNIQFYTIDAGQIAKELGLGRRINMIMQAAAFKLSAVVPIDVAVTELKKDVVKLYGKKGDKVVNMNHAAIDQGVNATHLVEIPASWKTIEVEEKQIDGTRPEHIRNILDPMSELKGDLITVGDLIANGMVDGTLQQGMAAFEKRGVSLSVPEWNIDTCIQCNQCAFVCPHAVIRPFLLNEQEVAAAPEDFTSKAATGLKELNYRIQVSVLDCTGCGICVEACPTKEKSLSMVSLSTKHEEIDNWEFAMTLSEKEVPLKLSTVKGSQFKQPLLEFSGACAGCGETPYVKLITQLYGDRMMIANATGCSSIWGASAPSTPYTTNHLGQGPSWGNSLFEDNAEYGYGMSVSVQTQRAHLKENIQKALAEGVSDSLTNTFNAWLDGFDSGDDTRKRANAVTSLLEQEKTGNSLLEEIYAERTHLTKRSMWIFGGDGWAYDIGYGGLDHVLSTGANVNIFVMDTEVYSNTGGQASKSTPAAAMAKFASSGKETRKKDLGFMAMSYGHVYVAQIAMGASQAQTIKAIREAEAYPGTSLIIAYAPCIAHGIDMACSQNGMKIAVDCGYWSMYRFNPERFEEGKPAFELDSKQPTWDKFNDFLMSQVRYSALYRQDKEHATKLFAKTQRDAQFRFSNYARLMQEL